MATFAKYQSLFGTLTKVRRGLQAIRSRPELVHTFKDDLVIPTQKVVIIGDQSAGKSSLMERLCEITLPTKTGICTRCPVEIRLTASENVGHEDRPGAPMTYTVKYQLPDQQEEVLVATPASSAEVHEAISAAQEKLLEKDPANKGLAPPRRFSMGLVIVEVANAPVNLTVVDLPGLINYDSQNPGNSNRINAITDTYLRDPWNIIVAVASCSDQLVLKAVFKKLVKAYNAPYKLGSDEPEQPGEDQDTAASADQEPAHNKESTAAVSADEQSRPQRTFCIVTKADQSGSGNPAEWVELLTGATPEHEMYRTIPQSNWFVTATYKEPTYTASMERERDFFESEEGRIWRDVSHKRKGITMVREALSDRLYMLMQSCVDRMRDALGSMEGSLGVLKEDLRKYDEVPPEDRNGTLTAALEELYKGIRHDVLQGAEDTMTGPPALGTPMHAVMQKHYRSMANKMAEWKPNPLDQCQKVRFPDTDHLSDNERENVIASVAKNPTAENLEGLSLCSEASMGHIGDVRNLIVAHWLRKWSKYATDTCLSVHDILEGIVTRRVASTIGSRYNAKLTEQVRDSLVGRLKHCYKSAKQQLNFQRDMEFAKFFSGDRSTGLVRSVIYDLELRPASSHDNRVSEYTASGEGESVRKLFEVCYKRYADYATLNVKHHLVAAFATDVDNSLPGLLSIQRHVAADLHDMTKRAPLPASNPAAGVATEAEKLLAKRKELEKELKANRAALAQLQNKSFPDYIVEVAVAHASIAQQRSALEATEQELQQYKRLLLGNPLDPQRLVV